MARVRNTKALAVNPTQNMATVIAAGTWPGSIRSPVCNTA